MLPAYEAVESEIPILTYPEDAWLPFQRTFVRACVSSGSRRHDRFNEPDASDGISGTWPRNRRNEIRQGGLHRLLAPLAAEPTSRSATVWSSIACSMTVAAPPA